MSRWKRRRLSKGLLGAFLILALSAAAFAAQAGDEPAPQPGAGAPAAADPDANAPGAPAAADPGANAPGAPAAVDPTANAPGAPAPVDPTANAPGVAAPADAAATRLGAAIDARPAAGAADPNANAPGVAAAGPGAGAGAAALGLQLDVSVNGKRIERVAAFALLPDGHLASRPEELRTLGVDAPGKAGELVPLGAIEGLSYEYDQPRQAINLIVAPARLLPQVVRVAPRPTTEHPKAQADWGAVANYTLFGSASKGGAQSKSGVIEGGSATFDARVFSPYGVARQTGIVGNTTTSQDLFLRLDSTVTVTDEDRMLVYRAGDSISGGLPWTRPVRFGGLQVQRSFSLRSDLVTVPLPMLSGSAAVPSSVDIFVNQQKLYSSDVAAGRFDVADLPVITGGGDTRLVVRDSSGREVETHAQFYVTPDMLAPGLFDFSVEAGAPRLGYGVDSFDYQPAPFGSFSLRGGVTDWLTLQSHGEFSQRVQNGGFGGTGSVFGLGAVSAAAAMSRYDNATGGLIYLSAQTRIGEITLQASTQRTFGDYQDIASTSTSESYLRRLANLSDLSGPALASFLSADVPRSVDQASIGFPVPFLKSSMSVSFANITPVGSPSSRVLGVSWSKNFDFGGALSASVYASSGATKSIGAFLSFSMPLGPLGYGSVGGVSNSGVNQATLGLVKPLDQQPGSVGWRIQDQEGAQFNRTAEASYRSSYGVLTGRVNQSNGQLDGSAQMDGGLAVTGDGVFASNRIDDAFGVVKAGAPNVDVYVENQKVGQTDSHGTLLVPNLRSFESNRVAIDPGNLPIDALPARTEAIVTPRNQSGLRVDFGVDPGVHAAELAFVDDHGAPLEAGRTGKLSNGVEFVVGYDGLAFVTGVQDSETVEIDGEHGACHASFSYQATPGKRVRIGPIVCR
jgi:outer membrane usher protein